MYLQIIISGIKIFIVNKTFGLEGRLCTVFLSGNFLKPNLTLLTGCQVGVCHVCRTSSLSYVPPVVRQVCRISRISKFRENDQCHKFVGQQHQHWQQYLNFWMDKIFQINKYPPSILNHTLSLNYIGLLRYTSIQIHRYWNWLLNEDYEGVFVGIYGNLFFMCNWPTQLTIINDVYIIRHCLLLYYCSSKNSFTLVTFCFINYDCNRVSIITI